MSYPVMTPSAARGVLDAILWKPAMAWHVERITVLAPIAMITFRRNEVSTGAPTPSRAVIDQGGEYPSLIVEDRRQQRNTVALRDVDYLIEARISLTDKAHDNDNLAKFVDMFRRRVEKGQRFHQPYLGCREFTCDFGPPTGDEQPIDETRDLGVMLWDIEYRRTSRGKSDNRPVFFAARLESGVLVGRGMDRLPMTVAEAQATLNHTSNVTDDSEHLPGDVPGDGE